MENTQYLSGIIITAILLCAFILVFGGFFLLQEEIEEYQKETDPNQFELLDYGMKEGNPNNAENSRRPRDAYRRS